MAKVPEFTRQEQDKLNQMFEAWMENDLERKTDNFISLNKNAIPDGIVFVGDSITEAYPLCEMFPIGYPLFNRGISGETSIELLERIDSQILTLKPKKVFLLIGTNDIERHKNGNDVGENIKKICQQTLDTVPGVALYVISIYPVNETEQFKSGIGKRTNQRVYDINQAVKTQIEKLDVTYIDLYDALLKDNNLNQKYTYDGLHLSVEGYRFVSKKLVKYLV